ncbi:MAG: PQQ-binding-like beta-propeller repeat protein [Candidatus Aminicenantes bacterium]|nr:PQQ-binding-like beta-propeller repeat protein [Candidatus Aminicenantes bacterium]
MKKKEINYESISWPIFRGDTALSGTTQDEPPEKPVLLWNFKTGSEIISSPVIGFGLVFTGSTDGKVYALDLKTGAKTWEFDAGDDIEASPLLADEFLYIGSLSGDFFALHARSGEVSWKAETEGPIYGSANWVKKPGSPEKLIFVGSHDNKMYCFSDNQKFFGVPRRGEPMRSFLNKSFVQTFSKVWPPAGPPEAKRVGAPHPRRQNFLIKWTHETDHFINGAPATDGEIIIFGGCDEKLRILSVLDGRKKGEVPVGSYIPGSAALVGNRAYLGHYGNKLACIDIENKKILWEYGDKRKGEAFFSSPAVGREHVVIGSRDGCVHCVDRRTGRKVWVFRTRDDVDSSPVIAGNKVVAASTDGRLYMIDLRTGKEIWSYEIGAAIIGCPAVAGGLIVTGAADGRIYVFGEDS